jgi:hypothetical protein
MIFPCLPAVLILLQQQETTGIACPPATSGEIVLRYRSPRELDSLIGPIYYPNREKISWPLRGSSYGFGIHVDGAPVKGLYGPMRPPGIDTIVALENGKLLLVGDAADIQEVIALVRSLDIPIPSIECRLEVVRGKQKLLTAMAAGKVGTVVKATNALTGPAAVAARVEVTFKVLPLGVGRYEIESQGKVSVPLARRGARLEKTFQSTREFTLGQTLTLDRVELGGETVQLLLTLNCPTDRSR